MLLVLPDLRVLQDRQVRLVLQVQHLQFQDLPVQRDQQDLPVQQDLVLMRFQSHYSSVVCRIGQ